MPAGSVHVLAFGRRNRAAAADQHAEQSTLDAADDAADDRADRGSGANACGFSLDAFAFERLRHRAAHRVDTFAHRDLVERNRQLPSTIGAGGLIDCPHDPPQDRPRRDQHLAAAIDVDDGGRLEPILDLRGRGGQFGLQPDIDLLPDWNGVAAGLGSPIVARDTAADATTCAAADASGRPIRALTLLRGVSRVPSRARPQRRDTIADVHILSARHTAFLAKAYLQVNHLVAQIIELLLQPERRIGLGAAKPRQIGSRLVDVVLKSLDISGCDGGLGRCDGRQQDQCRY